MPRLPQRLSIPGLILIAIGLAMQLVAACALLQQAAPPVPQSPRQAVVLAGYEAAAVVDAASDCFEQGLIDHALLERVLTGAKEVRTHLDTARQALAIDDLESAAGQLQLANTVLATLRTHLGGER